jgi:hypothetical protein
MVNSKDFNQDYNSYYRPTPERNDPDFFPQQGTLPLYFFKNGILQNTEPNDIYLREEDEEDEYIQINSNYYLYFIFLILFFIILFVKWVKGRKVENLTPF